MDEDVFNMQIRKFLKKVGITAQREIEKAVREELEAGKLTGNEHLKVTMRLEVGAIGLTHLVEDKIKLE